MPIYGFYAVDKLIEPLIKKTNNVTDEFQYI